MKMWNLKAFEKYRYFKFDWDTSTKDPKLIVNMHKIKRLYEFLELEQVYPYSFSKIKEKERWYSFKSNDNTVYWVMTELYFSKILNKRVVEISWATKDQFLHAPYYKPFSDFTSKTININDLFKILNTVFKIFFDDMRKRKIEYGKISSCKKSKFKVYKQIIEEEKDVEIIKIDTENWGKTNKFVDYILFKIDLPKEESEIKKQSKEKPTINRFGKFFSNIFK